MTVPTFSELENHLSAPRLGRYLAACAGDQSRAVELYQANMKISQAFHPLLGLVEVVLRNNLNLKLTAHFADADWILNQRTGFMSDAILARGNFYVRSEVERCVNRLTRSRVPIGSGRVIADLQFGFWTALFDPQHYRLLRGAPIRIFSALAPGTHRSNIFQMLTSVREFRNRISHNEPVCFRTNNIDFAFAAEAYDIIRRLLERIDGKLIDWLPEFDRVPEEIREARKI